MSLSLIDDILLRVLVDANLTAKGSELTWVEEDINFKIIRDALSQLGTASAEGFEEYDNGTVYSNVDPDYVVYNGNIWKYINATPTAGVAPDSDPLYWSISSTGAFSHQKNKDTYLDLGGIYEVSAQDIYNLIQNEPNDIADLYTYIDAQIAAVEGSDFTQGGDTFGTAALLGTNDAFSLLFRTNNTSRGGIDSAGKFMFGLTSPLTDTHKSNKSHGNTSGTYSEQWTASDSSVLAWLRNDGLFNATAGYAVAGVKIIAYNNANSVLKIGENAGPNVGAGTLNVFLSDLSGGGIVSGSRNVILGVQAQLYADGDDNFAFGRLANSISGITALNQTISLGNGASTRADNQLVIGGSQTGIYQCYLGGVGLADFSATPQDVLWSLGYYPPVVSNQNNAADILISAPPARGTGNSGNIKHRYAVKQVSGTTLQTWADGLVFEANTGYIWSKTSTGENVLLSGTYQSKSANYTALITDSSIDCTGGNTITLHTAVGYKGKPIDLKNTGGGLLIIDGNGSETIDGSLTINMAPGVARRLISNGTNWLIY